MKNYLTANKKKATYLASFFLPILIMLIVWVFNGNFPFGSKSLMAVDFGQQYIGFYAYLKETFLKGDWSALLYSFEKSIGGEMIGVLGYYLMSPFNIFYIILPISQFKWAITLTITLRYGFIGLAFALLLIKRYKGLLGRTWLVPLMATSYALSGMLVSYQMNVLFYDGMIMLPLLILYLEEALDGKSPFKYVLCLALTLLMQFYIGYMICIFVALYACYYMAPKWMGPGDLKERTKQFFMPLFQIVAFSFLAATTTFVTLYPIILNLMRSKGTIGGPLLFKWEFQINPLDILAKLTIGAFDNQSWAAGPSLPNIYVGALALVGFLAYFRYAKAPKARKIAALIITSVFFLSFSHEFTSKLWHMGQNPAGFFYRFSWIFSFFMVLLAFQTFSRRAKVKKVEVIVGSLAIVLSTLYIMAHTYTFVVSNPIPNLFTWISKSYLLVFAFLVAVSYVFWKKSKAEKKTKFITLVCGLVGFFVAIYLLQTGHFLGTVGLTLLTWIGALLFFIYRPQKTGRILVILMTVFELGLNAYLSQSRITNTDAYTFTDAAVKLNELGDAIEEHANQAFYRIGTDFFYSKVDPLIGSYNGLSNFSSSLERSTINLFASLGNNGGNAATFYANGTPLSDTLLGVRYYVTRQPTNISNPTNDVKVHNFAKTATRFDIESYYTKIAEDNNFIYYENPNVISLAYGTNTRTQNIKFGQQNPVSNNNIILNTLSNKEDVKFYTKAAFNNITLDNVELDESTGQQIYRRIDNSREGTITFSFTPQSSWTYYFQAPYALRKSANLFSVRLNGQPYSFTQMSDQAQLWQLAHKQQGQLIELQISLISDEELNLTGNALVRSDDSAIETVLQDRLAQSMTVEKATNTQIEGSVNITDDSTVMMTSIPYNPGWTVTVDGKTVETKEAWESLLSFPITPGTHKITMSFSPQGLKTGLLISILSIGGLAYLYFLEKQGIKES